MEGVWSQRSIFPRKNPFSFSYLAPGPDDKSARPVDLRLLLQRSQRMLEKLSLTCARLIEDAEAPAPFASPRDGKLLKRLPQSLKGEALANILNNRFNENSELAACANACCQAASNSKKARGGCGPSRQTPFVYTCASSSGSPSAYCARIPLR